MRKKADQAKRFISFAVQEIFEDIQSNDKLEGRKQGYKDVVYYLPD